MEVIFSGGFALEAKLFATVEAEFGWMLDVVRVVFPVVANFVVAGDCFLFGGCMKFS